MSVSSANNQSIRIFSLDEILQDTPETANEELHGIEETYQSYKEELNLELKTTDKLWLEFQAGQCEQYGKAAKSMLYRIVKSSVGHPENCVAAANAITILKVMKVSFSCLDIAGVQIPEADLSSAILDRADLSGANLEKVSLINASLNGTNMKKANLEKAKFGLPFTIIHEYKTLSGMAASPDNRYLVSEDYFSRYFWDLSSKAYIRKLVRAENLLDSHNSQHVFTPDGRFLFTYDGEKHVDILSVGDFKHIRKLKVFDEEVELYKLLLTPNGTHLIILSRKSLPNKFIIEIWEIQKTENNVLDIKLKKEGILPYEIGSICFSKKFPVFYCFKNEFKKPCKTLNLGICNIEELGKADSKLNKDDLVNDSFIFKLLSVEKGKDINYMPNLLIDTGKNNEELLFISIHNAIYSINILKGNEHNWLFGANQFTKVITEIDSIYNMQILEKTHELIYKCGNAICLYSIRNSQFIGKFRLIDIDFNNFSVSHNGAFLYISYSNKVSRHSVDALKESKYISYEKDSKATCFSLDMSSIISLSNSFFMQIYNIETGNALKTHFLQKIQSHVLNKYDYTIQFSLNAQHIFIYNLHYTPSNPSHYFLYIINSKNEERYLEATTHQEVCVLSNNSEYLALVDSNVDVEFKKTLYVYKTTPSKQCIGQFDFQPHSDYKIALSAAFHNFPKIALINASGNVILYNFVFKNEVLEIFSQNELLVEKNNKLYNQVLQLVFTENDTKLIIACKKELIIWDIENSLCEKFNIQANYLDISCNGSLLIYHNWSEHDKDTSKHQLCLWSLTQKKPLIVQSLSLAITKIQISPDNRYIIGTAENGGMYVWKILENSFRLLWRTSHHLQTEGLILGDNNLEKDVEEDLITKMGAIKL